MSFHCYALTVVMLLFPALTCAVPAVSNVSYSQVGGDVTVTYDLASPNGV